MSGYNAREYKYQCVTPCFQGAASCLHAVCLHLLDIHKIHTKYASIYKHFIYLINYIHFDYDWWTCSKRKNLPIIRLQLDTILYTMKQAFVYQCVLWFE